MTKLEAKNLTLEVWRYLRDHPKIDNKRNLPTELYEQIACLKQDCPLCELFCDEDSDCDKTCKGCPLYADRTDEPSEYCGKSYYAWAWSVNADDPVEARRISAGDIVKMVEAWELAKSPIKSMEITQADSSIEAIVRLMCAYARSLGKVKYVTVDLDGEVGLWTRKPYCTRGKEWYREDCLSTHTVVGNLGTICTATRESCAEYIWELF